MIMINLAQENISLAEALNAALDVAGHCKNVPVYFVFQGVEFIVTSKHENVCVPHIIEPRMIEDFDDEVLIEEYYRRIRSSQEFRYTVETLLEKYISIELAELKK